MNLGSADHGREDNPTAAGPPGTGSDRSGDSDESPAAKRLHARQVAIAAGATGEQIDFVAGKMVAEKVVRIDRAEEILKEIKK